MYSISTSSRNSSRERSKEYSKNKVKNGLNINKLQGWSLNERKKQLNNEESKQEIALMKMKNIVISNAMVVKIQSFWRMKKCHFKYKKWRKERFNHLHMFFRAWYTAIKAEISFRYITLKRPFREWSTEAQESKRLSNLALSIFKRAVNNSKLTPQAVMAYFNPSSYADKITEAELNSIRRLMLKCLFNGWSQETKLLRISRFKAGQILTRTMRRTFGNLSSKEMLLFTLHIWHRLAAVNAAESRGDPVPTFTQPYIPEWPKILKNITMKRIRKIRAADRAQILIQKRAFKGWIKAIQNDNTPDDTDNQCKAEAHYVESLMHRVLIAWWRLSRERGKVLRRREAAFRAWAIWAPRNRRLKAAKRILHAWTCQSIRASFFRKWATAMHGIIASRTHSLRELRQNLFQPKVLYLCYTLLNRVGHLMLLDCWQRWKKYWTMRHRWKTTKFKFRTNWYHQRMSLIFNGWKEYVQIKKSEELSIHRKTGILTNELSEGQVNQPLSPNSNVVAFSSTSIPNLSSANSMSSVTSLNSQSTNSTFSPMTPQVSRRLGIIQLHTKGSILEMTDRSERFVLQRVGWYSGPYLDEFVELIENGSEGLLEHSPSQTEFELCCHALWSRNPSLNIPSNNSNNNNNNNNNNNYNSNNSNSSRTNTTELHPTLKSNSSNTENKNPESETQTPEELMNSSFIGMDPSKAISAILEGIDVSPEFIEKISVHIGDKYIPLVAVLLSRCVSYVAKRVLLNDCKEMVLRCNNPLIAMMIGHHISRWEQLKITRRELNSLTNDNVLSEKIGSKYQTNILLRIVTTLLFKKRVMEMVKECQSLDTTHQSEKEEVSMILRRQRVAKLLQIEISLRKLLDLEVTDDYIQEQQELITSFKNSYFGKVNKVVEVKEQKRAMDPWIKNLDLGSLLREYALLTGSMTDSARQIRYPLLVRDDGLLQRGLEKQARADYLSLKSYVNSILPKKLEPKVFGKAEEDINEEEEQIIQPNQTLSRPQTQSLDLNNDGTTSKGSIGPNNPQPNVMSSEISIPPIPPVNNNNNNINNNTASITARTDFSAQFDPTNSTPNTIIRTASRINTDRSESNGFNGVSNGFDRKSLIRQYSQETTMSETYPETQQQTTSLNSYDLPLDYILETWWPKLPKKPPVIPTVTYIHSQNTQNHQKLCEEYNTVTTNLQTRYFNLANQTVARIVYILEQTGLPTLAVPHLSNYCTIPPILVAYPGVYQYTPSSKVNLQLGVNFIESIHHKPSRLIQIKHFKWWLKKYWQPNRISLSLENEIKDMETIIQEIGNSLKYTQKMVKFYDGEVKMYTSYLSSSRETMIAIGTKTRQYVDEFNHTKHAKLRLIHTVEKTIAHHKDYIQELKQLLTTVRLKIDTGKLEEALEDLTTENVVEDYGSQEKLLPVVKLAFQKREDEIPILIEKIQVLEGDIKRHENDLKVYERQSKGVKGIFTHLAGEKFTSIVDIQNLMSQKTKKLAFWKSKESIEKKFIRSLNKYCDEIMEYSDHLTNPKRSHSDNESIASSSIAVPQTPPPPTASESPLNTERSSFSRSGSRKSVFGGTGSKSFRELKTPKSRTERKKNDLQSQNSLIDFEFEENDELLHDESVIQVVSYDSTDDSKLLALENELKSPNSSKKLTILNLSNENLKSLNEGKLNGDISNRSENEGKGKGKGEMEGEGEGEEEDVRSNIDEKDIFDRETPRSETENSLVGKFNGFHVKTGRISLTEFTKRASEIDKAALSRRPTGYYESESSEIYESVNDEIKMKLTEEQIAEMGTEIQQEYWSILALMEKQPEIKKKTNDGSSASVTDNNSSITTIESIKTLTVEKDLNLEKAFQDLDEDEEELKKRLNRTARLYHNVKKYTQLEDRSMVESKDEFGDDASMKLNGNDPKKLLKTLSYEELIIHQTDKKINQFLQLDDYISNDLNLQNDRMWQSIDLFTAAPSVSMSTLETGDKHQSDNNTSRLTSRAPSSVEPYNKSRRKAVPKVVVMDPYAIVGSKNMKRLKYNSSHEEELKEEAKLIEENVVSDEADLEEENKLRRTLSAISEPDNNNNNDNDYIEIVGDDNSINSKEKYWSNGAPLGHGPLFEQDDEQSIDENEASIIERFQKEMSEDQPNNQNSDQQQQQQQQILENDKKNEKDKKDKVQSQVEEGKSKSSKSRQTMVGNSRNTIVASKTNRNTIRKAINSPEQKSSTPPSPQPVENSKQPLRKTRATIIDNSAVKSGNKSPSGPSNTSEHPSTTVIPKKSISSTRNSIIQKSLPTQPKSYNNSTILSTKITDDEDEDGEAMSEVSDVTSPTDLIGENISKPIEKQRRNDLNIVSRDHQQQQEKKDYIEIEDDDYDDENENEYEDEGEGEDEHEDNNRNLNQKSKSRSLERTLSNQSTDSMGSSHHFSESDRSINYNPVSSVSVIYGQQKNKKVKTEIPLPEYGGQAIFLDGKWTVVPSKHNFVVKNETKVNLKDHYKNEDNSSTKKTDEIPLISRQSSRLLRSASKVAEMEARELSPNPRSPKSQIIGTPQKGVSNVEKTGRGGLKSKKSLEIRGSFNEDDMNDQNRNEIDDSIGYSSWKNDFFSGLPQTPLNVLNRQESDGLRSTSPESLSIIDSYQPQTRYSLTAPSTSPPHQVIPIMKKSYFNRTVEDVHPYVPTLNDFVKKSISEIKESTTKEKLNAAKQEEKNLQQQIQQPIYSHYSDLTDSSNNPYKKTIHAVIGPIEEGSVETSISHGLMSDSTFAIDTHRSDALSPSPQPSQLFNQSSNQQISQQPQQPPSIMKKERSLSINDDDIPGEKRASKESTELSREIHILQSRPSQELRFSDNLSDIIPDNQNNNNNNNNNNNPRLSKGKTIKSPRRRRNNDKNSTRIIKAAENVKKMYVIANTAAGKGNHQPLMSRSELNRKLHQTNDLRKLNFIEPITPDTQTIRGEQSKFLPNTEICGIGLQNIEQNNNQKLVDVDQEEEGEEGGREGEDYQRNEYNYERERNTTEQYQDRRSLSANPILTKFQSLQTKNLLLNTPADPLYFGPDNNDSNDSNLNNNSTKLLNITGNNLGIPVSSSSPSTTMLNSTQMSRLSRGIIQPTNDLKSLPSTTKFDEIYTKFNKKGLNQNLTLEEALQIHTLAQDIQGNQSNKSKFDSILNNSTIGNENYIPIYMRSSKGQSQSSNNSNSLVMEGNLDPNNEQNEDETLLKAYAAVLGLDWFSDNNNNNNSNNDSNDNNNNNNNNNNNPSNEEVINQISNYISQDGGNSDTLHNLISNMQNIRQKTPISPHLTYDSVDFDSSLKYELNENSLSSSKNLNNTGRLSAPKPPKPSLSSSSSTTTSTTKSSLLQSKGIKSKKSALLTSPINTTHSPVFAHDDFDNYSCDDSIASNQLQITPKFSNNTQQQQPQQQQQQQQQSYLDDYERELDDDLRDYLRSYNSGIKESNKDNSSKSKRLMSSHSANSVVKAARIESEQQNTKESFGLHKQNKLSNKPSTTSSLRNSYSTSILPSVHSNLGSSYNNINNINNIGDKLPGLSSNRLGLQSISLSQSPKNLKNKNKSQTAGTNLGSLDFNNDKHLKKNNQLNMTIN